MVQWVGGWVIGLICLFSTFEASIGLGGVCVEKLKCEFEKVVTIPKIGSSMIVL